MKKQIYKTSRSGDRFYMDFHPLPTSRITLNLWIRLNEKVEVMVNGCSSLSKNLDNVPAGSTMWRIVRKSDRIMVRI